MFVNTMPKRIPRQYGNYSYRSLVPQNIESRHIVNPFIHKTEITFMIIELAMMGWLQCFIDKVEIVEDELKCYYTCPRYIQRIC